MIFTEEARPQKGPDWLQEARARAWERIARDGLPSRKDEDWTYTDLSSVASAWQPDASRGDAPATDPMDAKAKARLLFVDGALVRAASRLPDSITPLEDAPEAAMRDALDAHDATSALNTAFVRDGAVINLAPQTESDAPLYLDVASNNRTARPLLLVIRLGDGARLKLVERMQGAGAGLMRVCAHLGQGAKLEHIRLYDTAPQSFTLSRCDARLAREASYASVILARGGALQRIETDIRFDDEGARADIASAILADEVRHCDITTRIDHAVPNCTSDVSLFGLLAGRAQGVFQCQSRVREGAQGTDARQHARALLMSSGAVMNAKPELAIEADDVQCAHGVAIGGFDEHALFYLRQRGIAAGDARRLLARAFLTPVLGAIGVLAPSRVSDFAATRVEDFLTALPEGNDDARV